ncbi:MAG: hypothetical protein HKUEN07_28790 [Rhodocyclaceae bacterium]|nr:MAG: hypothetical protein HKUEN07_28790 [Rhodocyclaceae bacterium]
MNKTVNTLGLAIAATLGAASADAALISATLDSVTLSSANGPSTANITSSTATWQYDDVTGIMTQTGGTLNARFNIGPPTTLFRHTATDLVIGAGGAASATTWNCIEGNFGNNVGASLCGNYGFGANFANESSVSYSGSSVSRTLGGDDVDKGPPQSLADYNGISTLSWVGTALTLSNSTGTSGITFVFNASAVPVPAAVWLFGSAVGLLGVVRRRAKA